MAVNEQKTEGRVDDVELDVIKLWQTIQGEGPRIGEPSVFVRFAGCNLQCPGCDTDYTSDRWKVSVEDLVHKIQMIRGGGLVVFTGGEPVRQDIGPLIHSLHDRGFEVQIETNGTFFRSNIPWGHITTVCSPKTPKLHRALESQIDALKYVVEAGMSDPIDGLPTSIMGLQVRPARPPKMFDPGKIFIQPFDCGHPAGNKRNTDYAIGLCYRFGYRLCLQTHKFVGLE